LQARAQSNVPVSAVAGVFPVQPDALFVVEGGSVNSLKDLIGKKVATATFTSSNVIWPLILANNSIDADKITLIKVDPAALVPMLATGQVDATINWTTAAPPFVKALGESGKKLKMLPWSAYGFDGYGYSVFASDKAITERPDVVRRVVKAWLKAAQMALADPKDVARSMKVIFPEMDAKIVEEQFLTLVPLLDNEITKKEPLGTLEPKKLAVTWEWTAKSQNIPLDKLDPEKAVNRSFLPK
jgi:NitT/TauT family transport system substrate-binding protein